MVVSQFTSEEYGEAYMFMNFASRNDSNAVDAVFKECSEVAIYGGENFEGTPTIVELDEDGKFTLELNYGEGVFVVPLK